MSAISTHPAAGEPDDVVLERIASNVDTFRRQRGWSLATVAAAAGMTPSHAKHIVHRRANPTLADVLHLANAFGASVQELTGDPLDTTPLLERRAGPRRYDPEGFRTGLGSRLRIYRRRKGLRASDLAQLAGIARSTLRAIELSATEASTRVIARVAHGLNVSFADLVEWLHGSVLAHAERKPPQQGQRELLCDTGGGDTVRMVELRLAAGQTVIRAPLEGGSTAMILALDGNMRVDFETQTVGVRRDEVVLLAADRRMVLTATDGKAARLLIVVRSPEPVD